MANTNANLAALTIYESAHPSDKLAFKQLQGLALIAGIDLVCGKKLTTNEVLKVVHMSLCTTSLNSPIADQFVIVSAGSIWRAIIKYEVLDFDDLMNLAHNYSWKNVIILTFIKDLFRERYPTDELVKDYILRTNGDITCKFYANNIAKISMNEQEFVAYLGSKTQDRDFSDWRLFALLDHLPTQVLRSVLAYVSQIEITDISEELKIATLRVLDQFRDLQENAFKDAVKVKEKLYALRYVIQDMIISRNRQVCGC